ncbi:energy transducer TonB family protein [Lichenibacterium dinghuense]|uniref:energy transducer TonB family protein n=1 Tax=Lichenibacterium dinghuense TaxID=2895977 RepID=UPI001F030207|nr:energy transducer TonB [Lichenibacterium sp. 6Y81]
MLRRPDRVRRRSTGLISIDTSGPTAADVPPDARLADAPHLQALHEPTPALRVVPRHILQQAAPVGRGARLRAGVGLGGGSVLVHVVLGAALVYLLSFRDAQAPREVPIPVDVVIEPAKPAGGGGSGDASAGRRAAPPGAGRAAPPGAGPAKAEAPKVEEGKAEPAIPAPPAQPPAPAAQAAPKPAAPPAKPAPVATAPGAAPPAAASAPKPTPAMPQPAGVPAAPKLVAPPPETARAATQAKENKPANLVPDEHQAEQATREARPAAIPDVLVTPDARAQTSVPAPSRAQAAPVERPTPPVTAKAPSQADKLAAALPMDASAMPMGFRSMVAGNATAQINAAYGSVVQGRIRQATAELSGAASSQGLSGAVAVSFTLDDAGGLANLSVVQSSGNAQLDAMVLHAIEQVAPFPPPPPEAEHTFRKAFLVGG